MSNSRIPSSKSRDSQLPNSQRSQPSRNNYNKQNLQTTPGEEFLNFLKHMGYESKYNKGEHFEYLFQDEKTKKFIKALMQVGKPENVLTVDEVERFEQLKKDGMVLYGTDLEKAVDAKRAAELRISEQTKEKAARLDELRELIKTRQNEVQDIKNKNSVVDLMIEEKSRLNENRQKTASKNLRESNEIDLAIKVAQSQLADKLLKLKELKTNVLNRGQSMKSSMVGWGCWNSIIAKEDRLNSTISSLVKDHVNGLIAQSEGFNKEGQQGEDGIRKILANHANNFERLQHCIIYELTRQAKLSISLAGKAGYLDGLAKCREKYLRTVRCAMDRKTMEELSKQTDDEIRSLEEVFEKEYESHLESVRQDALVNLKDQIGTVTESKDRAQRTRNSFFINVYKLLEGQKVRLDVLRSLLKSDISFYIALDGLLREFAQKYETLQSDLSIQNGISPDSLTSDDRGLREILRQFEIPASVMHSTSKVVESLMFAYKQTLKLDWEESLQRNLEEDQYLSNIKTTHQQLVEMFEELNVKYISIRQEERRKIEALELEQAEALKDLEFMEANHDDIVQKSILEKEMLIKQMDELIASAELNEN